MKKIIFTIITICVMLFGLNTLAVSGLIDVSGTVRDFQSSHPDFQKGVIQYDPGIVETTLGSDGKPVYTSSTGNPTTTDKASFDQWYNDSSASKTYNDVKITLDNTITADPNVYTYENDKFFLLDIISPKTDWEGQNNNYWFTYEINTDFTYNGGEYFKFTGDDDVFVFINNQLVIDLGGVHGAMSKTIQLDSLGLTTGQNYSFDLFFAERHTTQSNFRIDTTMSVTPVPEPSTLLLFGTGMIGIARIIRKRIK